MTQQTQFRKNAQGHLVPVDLIKPIDLERDALVVELIRRARGLSEQLRKFKLDVFADFDAFVLLSAEQYGAKLGGQKGNVTLQSFDGRFKVVRQMQESLTFDERLQAAKQLIDECITDWSRGSRPEIRALINDAFQVDKEGRINVQRVLSLKRLDIRDEKWQTAMQAIADSVQVASSRSYVRFYERIGDSDQYQAISLDLSKV